MKRAFVATLAAVLMVAAAPQERLGRTDKAQLQGSWRLASVEVNQKPIALETLKADGIPMAGTLTIKGDNYSFRLGKHRLEITFKTIPNTRPNAIDLTVTEGPQKGQVYHGIYRLEGDTYTICRPTESGKARPTEFATRPDSGLMLVVWKREKSR